MQNRMEKLIEFVETIKNKVHDWWVSYNRKLWTTHIFVYSGLLLLVIFVGAVTFAHFNLFHTDADSARYMLSALVQSQAAIVAIVITLTLIAVQLTASAYSPRVIDIFKKNPDMWILLGCYGVSIFYGFIVLKLVEGAEGDVVSQSPIWSLGWISISFEFFVSLAYWLGAFTFVALFLYMRNIIRLLKPENIINRLAVEITKDKILNPNEDPIQPIVDIIHGSIMKYDLETTRVGLKAATDYVIKIIDSGDEEKILRCFCSHLRRVGRLAASREDEESTTEVITKFLKIGESTTEKGLEDATSTAAWLLGAVGKAAAKNGLGDATMQATESLGLIGKAAAKNGLENATWNVAWSLEGVAKAAAEKGLGIATWHGVVFLGSIGILATKNGLEDATRHIACSLGGVGRTLVEKGLEDATATAAYFLAKLTILSEEIVKTEIQNYESKLKEQDCDSFQKFMEIYEQELEKLRAEE